APLAEQMHFECRLGSSGRVDLLGRVDHSAARQVQARWGASIFSRGSWAGISALCLRWPEDPRLAAALSAVWFEFDLERDQTAGPIPTPRLFLELRSSARVPAPEVVALFDAAFSLMGLAPAGNVLTAALEALPHSSRLLAIG